jgi:transcriptional regulator with XRE-family HTH domain
MTRFKYALGLCGLSQSEAAEYLGVSVSSVEKWSRGVKGPPIGVWEDLARLWAQIKASASLDVAGDLQPGPAMAAAALYLLTDENKI